MKAIILAAGRGSRMKGLTDNRPKCLVEVGRKSLLDLQIMSLREAGIKEIAIVTGYKRELLTSRSLKEFHNPRWASTNMVSSLSYAGEWLEQEPCIVSYSDIIYDPQAAQSLIESQACLAVTFDVNWLKRWEARFGDPLLDAETFRLNSDSTLKEIGKTPNSVEEIQGQYMGLLRFTPMAWRELKRIRGKLLQTVQDSMHMTGALQMILESGLVPIQGIPFKGNWAEIDSETDLNYARLFGPSI